MESETKMPEEFYDWLDTCPVKWVREKICDEGLIYFFSFPEDDSDDEEETENNDDCKCGACEECVYGKDKFKEMNGIK